MFMPKDNQISEKYRCSITHQIMIDPVFAADGYTYEREAIEQWLQTHDTSPKTNIKLKHKDLTDNHDKRSDVLDFLDNHFELYEGNEVYIPQSWMAEFVAAIKGNQPQEVQRWLDKDRRLLSLNLEGNSTALHLACEFSSPELVDILLKILKKRNKLVIQSNPGYKSVYLNVLLERALNSRDLSHCELLLSLGAELDQPEVSNQNTLLHRMVINDNSEAVSWLLNQRVVLESLNTEGNTPLLLSVIHNRTNLTELLLINNANSKVKNVEQQSPVLIALLNQNEPMLRLLVGAKKAVLPPLHLALELNDNEIIKALLQQSVGAIEAQDERGRTPFYSAVKRGNLEAARLFLEQEADYTICGEGQENVLHVTTERGDTDMLKYLLQTKVVTLIDVQNAKGETPLHLAVQFERDSIIPLLLEAGAYHKIKNEQDKTPIELARQSQKQKTANLIEKIVRTLKREKIEQIGILNQVVREQSVRIHQLEQSLGHEEKIRAELQEKFQVGKKIIISHFNNFKRISKSKIAINELLIKSLHEHDNPVRCLQPLPSGELVSGSEDKTIKIWDLQIGRCIKTLEGHTGSVLCLQLLPSGELVSGSMDKTIKIWDLKNGSCLQTLQGHTDAVRYFQRLPSGDLASSSYDSTIKIWDLQSGNCIKVLEGHEGSIYCMYLLSSGELVSGSEDETIKIWDLESGNCIKTLQGHTDGVRYLLQGLSVEELISCSSDYTIKIWDLKSGTCIKSMQEHAQSVSCLQLLPSGELVSGSEDKTIKIWDLESGNCIKTLQGHTNIVRCIKLLPSGELVSSSDDNTINVWDLMSYVNVLDERFEKQLSCAMQ